MATDLKKAFEQVSTLFNQGKYDELGQFFDVDAIMKRVDDPGSISGIGNLIAYLNTHQKPQNPQFENIEISSQKEPDATQGIVSGKAEYRDTKSDKNTIPVHFTFVFTREDAKSDWLLINAFAVPR
ncbi:MAG: hypothetical protein WAU82_00525 [Candidatus Binatus sp.]|uniref:hypothetical protein n=1 Tax=Candidatus Binatus sp. TaxID=2811406 RepID=UPI003BAE5072